MKNDEPVSAAQLAEQIQESAPQLIQYLYEIAQNGEKDLARIKAIDILLDRGYGKVGVVPRTKAEEADPMAGLTADERIAMLEAALEEEKKKKVEALAEFIPLELESNS